MKNRHRYTHDWYSVIRPTILTRDKFKCTFCGAPQGSKGYYDKNHFIEILDEFMLNWALRHGFKVSRIHLQVMHLDQDTTNNNHNNLASGCPKCHFRYDNQFKPHSSLLKGKQSSNPGT